MKKVIIFILAIVFTMACGKNPSVDTGNNLAKIKELISKKDTLTTEMICADVLPLVNLVFKDKTAILKISEIVKEVPEIKKCDGFQEIQNSLDMANGYKGVLWGSSLENTKSKLGPFKLIIDDVFYNSLGSLGSKHKKEFLGFIQRFLQNGLLGKEIFCTVERNGNGEHLSDCDPGQTNLNKFKMYSSNGIEKEYLFYLNEKHKELLNSLKDGIFNDELANILENTASELIEKYYSS